MLAVWVVTGMVVSSSIGLLVWARNAKTVHYVVQRGGMCYRQRRGAVAARGFALGALLGLLPSYVIFDNIGPLAPGGLPVLLSFVIGTTVYSNWIMRHWNGLDTCHDCSEVKRRLDALHVAGTTLGSLLIAVLLAIAWPQS